MRPVAVIAASALTARGLGWRGLGRAVRAGDVAATSCKALGGVLAAQVPSLPAAQDVEPRQLKLMHYSSKYENSPMPYSVFFYGGYAIHGTGYVSRLGSPASHGCVRLHTANAAELYYLIKRVGRGNTRIRIVK